MNREDLQILSYMRNHCRNSIVDMSRDIGLPVLDMVDRLKRYEGGYIKNYTCVLDFSRVGFKFDVHLLLKTEEKSRKRFERWILHNRNVNSFFWCEDGRYLFEVLFRDEEGLQKFLEKIKTDFEILDIETLKVLQEFKRESFLESE